MKKIVIALKQYQTIIIAVVLLMVCIFGFFIGVYPASQKVMNQYAQIQELQDEVDKLKKKSSILDNLDEPTLREQLMIALTAVPADKSLPTIFSTVEAIAAQTNVSVTDMNVTGGTGIASGSASKETAVESKLGTRIVPASVTIEGSTEAVKDFISLMPTVRRLLRIRTFTISFGNEEEPISVTVQMDAFYSPFPTTLGSAASEVSLLSDGESGQLEELKQFPLVGVGQGALPAPAVGRVKENPFAP